MRVGVGGPQSGRGEPVVYSAKRVDAASALVV